MDTLKKVLSKTVGGITFTLGGLGKALLTLLLIGLTTGLLFMCIFAYYVKTTLTDDIDLSLEDFTLNQSSVMWYEDKSTGEWKELCKLNSLENRIWIDFEDIPQDMLDAIVAIEDKRFYEHHGVDWYRTTGAMVNMFITMRNDFGGSTITQQLIKNLTKQDDITVQRKLLEIFQALELEKTYDKQEILTWYLNVVYFGEGCYGIEAAAQTYFGKSASQLTLAECASLAGITNNPSRYDPFISRANNKERQEIILDQMYRESGFITKEEYDAAMAEELPFVRTEASEYTAEIYTYFEEVVIRDVLDDLMEQKGVNEKTANQLLLHGGYQIYTTFDPGIQAIVDNLYVSGAGMPTPYKKQKGQFQSAIVIEDPFTGAIVALSGGTGEKTANFVLNRATNAYRSPGSSIKPLASYGPAMEYGLITPNTEVNDSKDITLSGTSWYPHNYSSNSYRGWTTVKSALASSLNTIPAQIVDKLTPQVSYDFMVERLGFETLDPEDADYAPMSLGQLKYGTTVREMTQAFGAFINDGVFVKSRTYTRVTDVNGVPVLENEPETNQAFSKIVADNMVNMLYGAVNYGTGGDARIGSMPVAGKTGTTTDNKDRYFVGFTPYYVAGVWTGFDDGERMYYGGNPAARIWANIMRQIHADLPVKSFPSGTYQAPTGIFGSAEDDVSPSPSPSETPTPSLAPDASATPPPIIVNPVEPPPTQAPTPTPPVQVVTPAPSTPVPQTPVPNTPEPPIIVPEPEDGPIVIE